MVIIKRILGVTPNTFRPPYGDIDDRVRAVARVMGLTPIMWYVFLSLTLARPSAHSLLQDRL